MAVSTWITRTQPGAQETAARVRALGLTPVIAPVLEVVSTGVDAPAKGTLAFTSRNGVRVWTGGVEHPVFCVGDATAVEARERGFTNIRSADGNVDDLSKLMLSEADPDLPVTHWAGRHVRGNLIGDLRRAGYVAERVTAYATQPTGQTAEADIIILHSPKAAELAVPGLPSVSLSQAIASAYGGTAMRQIAQYPTEDALMVALLTLAKGLQGA